MTSSSPGCSADGEILPAHRAEQPLAATARRHASHQPCAARRRLCVEGGRRLKRGVRRRYQMGQYLYKISQPRDDLMFYPSIFWHTPDWESSTTHAKEGYIRDTILYAGDFDEVNIHLFPRVRTIRVRARDAGRVPATRDIRLFKLFDCRACRGNQPISSARHLGKVRSKYLSPRYINLTVVASQRLGTANMFPGLLRRLFHRKRL